MTVEVDTTEDTYLPKCSNTNVACILYHFNEICRHESRDEHGTHASDEMNSEIYGSRIDLGDAP